MVTSTPSFKIGDRVSDIESGKKGTIVFVHISHLLENIFYYNVVYDDNSRSNFIIENELQKIYDIREPI